MGFNLSGIVINKNFADNIEELQEQLGLSLEYIADINFQEASANYKDDDFCDIYFSEKGTLIFVSAEHCLNSRPFDDGNTLIFILSEFAMAFDFRYYENGNPKRSFFELNREMQFEKGEKLPCEESESDGSDAIWKQLGVVLGKTFWSIEFEEKAVRYKIV